EEAADVACAVDFRVALEFSNFLRARISNGAGRRLHPACFSVKTFLECALAVKFHNRQRLLWFLVPTLDSALHAGNLEGSFHAVGIHGVEGLSPTERLFVTLKDPIDGGLSAGRRRR